MLSKSRVSFNQMALRLQTAAFSGLKPVLGRFCIVDFGYGDVLYNKADVKKSLIGVATIGRAEPVYSCPICSRHVDLTTSETSWEDI